MRGLGAATACGDLSGLNQREIARSINRCVSQGIAAAGDVVAEKIGEKWGAIYGKIAAGGAAGGSAGAALAMSVDETIALLVSTAEGDSFLADIAIDLIAIIEVDLGIALTTISVSTGEAGIIGFIIGVLIAAIEVLVDVLNPRTVVTTYGITVSSKDYIETHLKNAGDYLASIPTSAGITPQWFARVFQLFLANPVWLWANQAFTGLCQPAVPDDIGGGDAVDTVFTSLPGASELLAQRQFTELVALLASSPGKLPLFMGVIPGPSGWTQNGYGPDVYPDPNPLHYNPAYLNISSSWPPDDCSEFACHTTLVGAADPSPWKPWPPGGKPPGIDPVISVCPPSSVPVLPWPNKLHPTDPSIYQGYNYAAPPHLVTNSNTTDATGKITGQTDPGVGIYFAQKMFPAVTCTMCLVAFSETRPYYDILIAQAISWANNQATMPSAADLGTGSKWNLEPHDVQTIQAQWHGTPVFGGGSTGSGATSLSSSGHLVKTAAVVGGLTAIGVSAYALYEGISVTRAGTMAYDEAKAIVKRPVTAIERRLHRGRSGRRR